MIKDQSIFSRVIILLILITLSLDSVWILSGENLSWSLLGLKGLIAIQRCYVRHILLLLFPVIIILLRNLSLFRFPYTVRTMQIFRFKVIVIGNFIRGVQSSCITVHAGTI